LKVKKIVVMAIVSVFLLSVEMGMLFVTQVVAEPASSPSHDVAVTEVGLYHLYRAVGLVKPLIGHVAYSTWKDPIEISVTVKNEGDYSESFNVTAYCNETALGTETVTLAAGENMTLTFAWRPRLPGYPYNPSEAWPYPVYTFSAEASVVPDETDTADNSFIDGFVKVQWPGDCNGDGMINILDLGKLGVHWLAKVGEPRYNANVDYDGDGEIKVLELGILGVWWLYKVPR